jgi:two-component system, sporulation sensor kinase E
MSTDSAARPTPAVHKPNLLLVDDHHSNLVTLQAVLSEREYNLIFAHSGMEAIELVQKHDIALILLDIQMPGMDGFETAKRIKAIEDAREIPIVFITAVYKEDPFVKTGYAAGAVDYFSKPFDAELLRLKVKLYSALHQKTFLLREREKRIRETEELLATGRRLSAALESLPVGVLIADADGRVRQVNQEVSRIWGYEDDAARDAYAEFLGWWGHDGHLVGAADGPMARALATGASTGNQITRIRTLDGQTKTILNSASPLRNLSAEVVGVVLVIQDVSEHKQIEQDIEQRVQRLISAGIDLEQAVQQH